MRATSGDSFPVHANLWCHTAVSVMPMAGGRCIRYNGYRTTTFPFAVSTGYPAAEDRRRRMPSASDMQRGSTRQAPAPTPDHIVDPNTRLLLRIKTHRDEQAFEALYRYYVPRVRAFLAKRGADDRHAQDLAQEAMVRVWRGAYGFNPARANASAWIFAITRNLHIDAIRRERRHQIDPDDPLLVEAEPETAEDGLVRQESLAAVAEAIKHLPAEQKQVLRLSYGEGRKQREIAEDLAIPLNTVKSRLRLAVERLRKAMVPE